MPEADDVFSFTLAALADVPPVSAAVRRVRVTVLTAAAVEVAEQLSFCTFTVLVLLPTTVNTAVAEPANARSSFGFQARSSSG